MLWHIDEICNCDMCSYCPTYTALGEAGLIDHDKEFSIPGSFPGIQYDVLLEIMEFSIILRMFVLEIWNLLIDPLEMHEKMC